MPSTSNGTETAVMVSHRFWSHPAIGEVTLRGAMRGGLIPAGWCAHAARQPAYPISRPACSSGGLRITVGSRNGSMEGATARHWRVIGGMAAVVGALHVAGLTLLLLAVERGHAAGTVGGLTLGIGLTAYTLGMRHAFDADHISAIDNTTRKLMADGQRPLSVGFFFSLGHSTIVFGARPSCSPPACGRWTGRWRTAARAARGHRLDRHRASRARSCTSSASSTSTILVGIVRAFREMRRGRATRPSWSAS